MITYTSKCVQLQTLSLIGPNKKDLERYKVQVLHHAALQLIYHGDKASKRMSKLFHWLMIGNYVNETSLASCIYKTKYAYQATRGRSAPHVR